MAKEKRVTVIVPADIHKEAKIEAAKTGKSLSDIMRDLLFGWLKSKEQPQK